MNPRLAAMATLCREVAIPASVMAWIAVFGSPGIDHINATPVVSAAPVVTHLAPLLAADAKPGGEPQPVAPVIASASALVTSASVTEPAAADPTPLSREPEPIVTASLDPAEKLPADTPPAQEAKVKPTQPEANPDVSSAKAPEPCLVGDACVDQYLWTLYQRTPKEDTVKIQEQRQVTVKKKGILVTLTRTFSRMADEDFAWKDPKAAETAGMPMMDYVIGGMDRDFKLKLSNMLRAAEQAGLSPGITSAFRDDFRQSIASGLKAANDRSYHGGSLRGGYGHGLAADVVSVKGENRTERLVSTDALWSWIDVHGKEFGIGRPYLGRDPPHVAPIDGKEYADHRPGMRARLAAAAAKLRNALTSRSEPGAAQSARTAKLN